MKTIGGYSEGRQNNFDFIRFVAATAVILSHSYTLTHGEVDNEWLYLISDRQSTLGDLAVGIFFVISGFLIAQSFDRSKSLGHYFLSRALRIFPALIAVVLLIALVVGPLISTYSLSGYFTNPDTYSYLLQVFIFPTFITLPGVFENNPFHSIVNGSLWTLNYEVMCYLALPAVALLLMRKWASAFVLLVASLIITMNFFYAPDYLSQFLCSCFLSGSLFYLFRKKIPLRWWIALPAFGLLILCIYVDFFLLVFPWLGAYVILYLSFVPRSALFRFAKYGDFSYGIYIWAFPVQQIVAQHYSSRGNFFNAVVSFPVILLLGILSWHLIEKRALSWKSRFKRIPAEEKELP